MNNNIPPSCPCKPDTPMNKYYWVGQGPIFGCYDCGNWCHAKFPLTTYCGIGLLCNYPLLTEMQMAPHHGEPSVN